MNGQGKAEKSTSVCPTAARGLGPAVGGGTLEDAGEGNIEYGSRADRWVERRLGEPTGADVRQRPFDWEKQGARQVGNGSRCCGGALPAPYSWET